MSKSKKNKAQAMVVVFIYISVVSLMGIYMMVYASNLHNMVIREINYEKGFYAGEAGLIQSFSQLSSGAGGAAVTMTFGDLANPIRVGVTGVSIGNGYTRIRAIVRDWQVW